MAENGCIRVGQTSSVYTLPSYILERAVGAFENLWFSPAEYSEAKTQRWSGLRVFPAPAKMQCNAVVGHCWLPLPLRQSVSRMPPLFSLYHIFKERRPFRRYRQFRGCPAYRIDRCSLCFLIRLFTYRFNTAVVWGYNLSVKLYSVHLSPVRSSCHFNRWLGCLIK